MKLRSMALSAVVAFAGVGSMASAGTMDGHTVIAPEEIEWGPAPDVLPAGAEAALLLGDPSKAGLFALRLKLPPGYSIAPHTHPADEVVTVVSGTFLLGMGETAARDDVETLPAGSFFALPPDSPHYAFTDEETVVQISTIGPWGLSYVNPEDDPRKVQ